MSTFSGSTFKKFIFFLGPETAPIFFYDFFFYFSIFFRRSLPSSSFAQRKAKIYKFFQFSLGFFRISFFAKFNPNCCAVRCPLSFRKICKKKVRPFLPSWGRKWLLFFFAIFHFRLASFAAFRWVKIYASGRPKNFAFCRKNS